MKLVNIEIEAAVLKIKFNNSSSLILYPSCGHLQRRFEYILQTVNLNLPLK